MKGSSLAAAVIVVGLLVLTGGLLVPAFTPRQAFWDDEDQAAYEQASTAAHAAAFGGEHDHSQPHSHDRPLDSQAEAHRQTAQAALAVQEARLRAAKASQKWFTYGTRAVGLILSVVGIVLYWRATRMSA